MAINKIKAHALNTRLFKQLCNENGGASERLLLHTKVQWLLKGNCLARFNLLFVTVVEFLQSYDPGFALEVMLIKNTSAYLSDIFVKFNELNLSLQRYEINLIKVKSALSGFNNKLTLYQRNLAGRGFFQCASLKQLDSCSGSATNNADIDAYSKHHQKLKADMQVRF